VATWSVDGCIVTDMEAFGSAPGQYSFVDFHEEGEPIPPPLDVPAEVPEPKAPAPVPPGQNPPPPPQGDLAVAISPMTVDPTFPLEPVQIGDERVPQVPVLAQVVITNVGTATMPAPILDLRLNTTTAHGEDGKSYEQRSIIASIGGSALDRADVPGAFELPPLEPGEAVTVTVQAHVLLGETRTLRAWVGDEWVTLETNTGNNVATTSTINGLPGESGAEPAPPLFEFDLQLSAPEGNLRPGEVQTVTMKLTNNTDAPLTNVRLVLSTRSSYGNAGWIFGNPAGVNVIDAYSVAANDLSLGPGESVEIPVPIEVKADTPIIVQATGDNPDGTERESYRSIKLPVVP
jgi:hypothetical protein